MEMLFTYIGYRLFSLSQDPVGSAIFAVIVLVLFFGSIEIERIAISMQTAIEEFKKALNKGDDE